MRALLCQRGETARARNCRKTSLSYRPCRRLGHGRPKYYAPSRLAMDACSTLCGQPVGQSRAPDICKEARQACKGSEVREGPIHEKAPPVARPASLGGKARRLCMRGGSRIRRRGRHGTCGPRHAGGTCPLGRGCRRGLSRGAETALNDYYSPVCVRPVQARLDACPHPAGACIVLPRAAPRSAAARTPRTGYCGRRRRSDRPFRTGFIRWLVEGRVLSQAPVFHEFLESIFSTLKSFFGRRVRSWLRTNAGGAPNTCKSRG